MERPTAPCLGSNLLLVVYQPHFGQASTLVPFVFVIWDAVIEPSALIRNISLLTSAEHGDRRGVLDVKAVKPIHALSAVHIALLRNWWAPPLFFLVVTCNTAREARVSE